MTGRSLWWPTVLWAAVILALTSLPASALPHLSGIPGIDKATHFALYAVLGLLTARSADVRIGAFATLAAMAVFAAADEWHQQWVGGRSADPADWLADVAGSASGFAFQRARPRQEKSS